MMFVRKRKSTRCHRTPPHLLLKYFQRCQTCNKETCTTKRKIIGKNVMKENVINIKYRLQRTMPVMMIMLIMIIIKYITYYFNRGVLSDGTLDNLS